MTRIPRRRRTGFTLIELLIVIIVIGILIALLLPAIFGAIKTANDAATISEETLLVNALNAFKDKYGSFPPSRVVLNETVPISFYGSVSGSTYLGNAGNYFLSGQAPVQGDTNGNDITFQQLARRSGQYLSKFFPRAKPNISTVAPMYWNDFNGNGAPDYSGTSGSLVNNWIYLEGNECLVFFLGGIANKSIKTDASGNSTGIATYAMTGFGRDPTAPFTFNGDSTNLSSGSGISPSMVTLNRYPSFYEWNSGRLGDPDGDTMLDYADYLTPNNGDASQRLPYYYFSSYDGAGYDPNDANISYGVNGNSTEQSNSAVSPLTRAFRVNLGLSPLTGRGDFSTLPPSTISSPSPNPYTTGPPVPDTTGIKQAAFQNPNSFQLISPGRDRIYGVGGIYDITASDRLSTDNYIHPVDSGLRDFSESDNLTNFNNNKLN